MGYAPAKHSGALFAALKEAGIKVTSRGSKAGTPEVPLVATSTSKPAFTPTRNLQHRTSGLLDWLDREPCEQRLFGVACVFAEIVAERRLKVGAAYKLLIGACWSNGLRKLLGKEGVKRTIDRAFRRVEVKLLTTNRGVKHE